MAQPPSLLTPTTIEDVLFPYEIEKKIIIRKAFKEQEHTYKNHMRPTQRDAVGRDLVTRMKGVIRNLQRSGKI